MDNISTITRAMSRDGSVRMIFCDSTAIVSAVRSYHQTSKTMTAALGRCLTAASLMGSLLKNKSDSLTLQIRGDGPAGVIICASDYMGNVRGYADHPETELLPRADGKLDVGGAVGHSGHLCIIRDTGGAEPYIGVSDIVSGEIAEDITNYFAQSEQTPTVCALGVRVNVDLSVKSAGGYLLQLMPGYDEKTVAVLENNINEMPSVSTLIANNRSSREIITFVLGDMEFDVFDEYEVGYVCECSRERYLKGLCSLPRSDIDEMLADGSDIETVCRFCNKKYVFKPSEITDYRSSGKERK